VSSFQVNNKCRTLIYRPFKDSFILNSYSRSFTGPFFIRTRCKSVRLVT